jgi:phosphomannomutase
MKLFQPSLLETPDFCSHFLSLTHSERRDFFEMLIARAGQELVPGCFRSYDIRVDEKHLSNSVLFYLGLKIVPLLKKFTGCPENKPLLVGVGRAAEFARPGSLRIQQGYMNALTLAGARVIDFGVTTTPDVYFGAAYLLEEGIHAVVNVTASHNPKKDNGLKHCIKTPEGFILSISKEQLSEIKQHVSGVSELKEKSDAECIKNLSALQSVPPIDRKMFQDPNHLSVLHHRFLIAFGILGKDSITELCLRNGGNFKKVLAELLIPPLKKKLEGMEPFKNFVLVLDFATGTMFRTKEIYSALGALVIPLDLERGFNPVETQNQEHLKQALCEAKKKYPDKEVLGIAHDEDGDRLAVMRSDGVAIEGDRLLAICCQNLHPGEVVVTEVKSRPEIRKFIESKKIEVVVSPTGFAFIKKTAVDMELLARQKLGKPIQMWAELSGHFGLGFDVSWFFDDAALLAVHLLSCLSQEIERGQKPGNILIGLDEKIPRYPSSGELNIFLKTEDPHYVPSSEEKEKFVALFTEKIKNDPCITSLDHTDGVQVFFKNGGWLLIRKSNNEDKLVLVTSAPTEIILEEVEKYFLEKARPLRLPPITGLVLTPEDEQGFERKVNAYLSKHL